MRLSEETLIPSWGSEGNILWLGLGLNCFLMGRSDETFADDPGVMHPAHCLTRHDARFTPTTQRFETRDGNGPCKVER